MSKFKWNKPPHVDRRWLTYRVNELDIPDPIKKEIIETLQFYQMFTKKVLVSDYKKLFKKYVSMRLGK